MIDPLERWAQYGEKPDYAGLLTFAGMPYTQDPAELAGYDVAIVGAPMDDLVSDRPGARLAPRAIRAASCPPGPAPRGEDRRVRGAARGRLRRRAGDPGRPGALARRDRGDRRRRSLAAGALPVVLGGDHSITEPARARRARRRTGRSASCTSTRTRTPAPRCSASRSRTARSSAGWSTRATLDGRRYAQIGLRGYWPGEAEFAWQAEHGITSLFMHDVRDLGIREVVRRAIAAVGAGPVYLTVDVDVLDPAFVPGTGTPEPGGMTAIELLLGGAHRRGRARARRRRRRRGDPDAASAPPTRRRSSPTAIVRETLTGLALRRARSRAPVENPRRRRRHGRDDGKAERDPRDPRVLPHQPDAGLLRLADGVQPARRRPLAAQLLLRQLLRLVRGQPPARLRPQGPAVPRVRLDGGHLQLPARPQGGARPDRARAARAARPCS